MGERDLELLLSGERGGGDGKGGSVKEEEEDAVLRREGGQRGGLGGCQSGGRDKDGCLQLNLIG